VVRGPDADEAAAACKGFNAKCKRHGNCCAGAGLRCVMVGKKKKGKKAKKRCRCKNGTCPQHEPCCIRGKCEELCDGECCADCFIVEDDNGIPQPGTDECCPQDMICGLKSKTLSDDFCCVPGEECADGVCCSNAQGFPQGSRVCGGKCCSVEACCNEECCGEGQVCVTTPTGDQCLSDDRTCENGEPDCFAEESCVGGVCCSGRRICSNGMGEVTCCAADEYCELPNDPFAVCCKINDTCNSFKGHRVRR
jgi:hypothetical protein